MKNFLVLLSVLAFTTLCYSQKTISSNDIKQSGRFVDINFGTQQDGDLGTTAERQAYVDISDWAKIDSISMLVYGTGELDVDSVDIYGGASPEFVLSTANTFTTALDLAAGIKGAVQAFIAGAGMTNLRGVRHLKVMTNGSGSGVGTTNNLHVLLHIYGTK